MWRTGHRPPAWNLLSQGLSSCRFSDWVIWVVLLSGTIWNQNTITVLHAFVQALCIADYQKKNHTVINRTASTRIPHVFIAARRFLRHKINTETPFWSAFTIRPLLASRPIAIFQGHSGRHNQPNRSFWHLGQSNPLHEPKMCDAIFEVH